MNSCRSTAEGRRASIGARDKESVCYTGTSTSDARRPVSASIGQGRSHGSRGQVDKSPFPARRSVAEEKERKEKEKKEKEKEKEKKKKRSEAQAAREGARDGWRRGGRDGEGNPGSSRPNSRARGSGLTLRTPLMISPAAP